MSLAESPRFTVIMATWGRGRHIMPSVRSVLAQELVDFELLVIGDACTDDTEQVVLSLNDPRLRFINLDTRWHTQSGPNNRGNQEAKGEFIAYIGHDDIWGPNHLSELLRTYRKHAPDIAVSGLLGHPLPGLSQYFLSGLGSSEELSDDFTPPTALSHRRDLLDRIGPWKPRTEALGPVDIDLERRAAQAGMRFMSTGVVTAHKFAAAQRYLSYLIKTSDEQEAALSALHNPDPDQRSHWLNSRVSKARAGRKSLKRNATVMRRWKHLLNVDFSRGIKLPTLRPLGSGLVLRQDWRNRPGYWHRHRIADFGQRWSIPGTNPRLLLPVTSIEPVRILFAVTLPGSVEPESIRFRINDVDVFAEVSPDPNRHDRLNVVILTHLLEASPSVLTIFQPADLESERPAGRKVGIAVGPVRFDLAN
jgi:glycosyltransferase involved in cell wall biosynthesis